MSWSYINNEALSTSQKFLALRQFLNYNEVGFNEIRDVTRITILKNTNNCDIIGKSSFIFMLKFCETYPT